MIAKKRILLGVIALIVVAAAVVVAVLLLNNDKAYDYDLSKYIKVGEYKGLEIEKIKDVSVSKKDVDSEIDERLKDAKTTKEKKDGTVSKGDTAKVDFEGTIDGKAFDGGTGEDAEVQAGDTQSYIEGFEAGIVGMKVGSTKTLDLKFPDDYSNAEVAGKDVQFKVTVKAVVENIIPSEEEYVEESSEYESVEEFEAAVEKELKKEKKEEKLTQAKSELWNKVVSSSKVKKYPEKELSDAKADVKKQFESYASQSGADVATLRSQMGLSDNKDYNNYIAEQAKGTVKNELVVYYIVQKEGIKLDADSADELEKLIEKSGLTDETFESQYGQSIKEYVKENKHTYEVSMLTEKVTDFIYKNAVDKSEK